MSRGVEIVKSFGLWYNPFHHFVLKKGGEDMADLKTVYTCQRVKFEGKRVSLQEVCLKTEDVDVLNKHKEETLRQDFSARNHMLDIDLYNGDKWQGQRGMCLPDAVIDPERKTVKHFMDTWSRSPEKRG